MSNVLKSLDSYTTRPKRIENEKGHTFITESEFDCLTDICAYGEFGGYRYCATKEQVDNADIYVIDKQGIKYFKDKYHGKRKPIVVYIKIPPLKRFGRLIKRDGIIKGIKRWLQDIPHFIGVGKLVDCSVKIKSKNTSEAEARIEQLWKRGKKSVR